VPFLSLQQRHPMPRSAFHRFATTIPHKFAITIARRTDPSSYAAHFPIPIDRCPSLAFSSATLCHDQPFTRHDDFRHDLIPTRHPNPVHFSIRIDQCCTLTFTSATLGHDQPCRFATTNPSAIRHDDSSAIRHTTTSSYRPVILCCSLPDSH
jgi:hypothetical protein